jgi:hypothetical protein
MRKIFKKISILAILFAIGFTLAACEPEVVCDKGYEKVEGECVLIVVPDETAPELFNVTDLAYTIGDDAPEYAATITATDNIDGDITDQIVVDSSLVDLETEGTYAVTITVSDEAGNVTTDTFDVVVTELVLSYEDIANMDIEALVIGDDLVLPAYTQNLTFFYWSSSNPLVLTNRGFVIPPPVGSDDVVVTLTCRAVNGPYVTTKDFDVTIPANQEVTVTSKEAVPFIGTSDEYVVEDSAAVDLYYVDNGTVPYIDIETYVNMIDGAMEADMLEYTYANDDQLIISYDVEWEDFDGSIVNETYTATFDFGDNTFHVDTFDFFGNYVAATESDYGDGLNYVDAEYVDSDAVTIDLGSYNFDIVIYDDAGTDMYLVPLHVTNLLFAHGIYYDAYFNGEAIYGIDTFSISGIDQDDPLWDDVRGSSFNDLEMAEDLKWATYNYTALAFDYFYGLKEDQGVDTYYNLLVGRAENWITGNDSNIYGGLFDFAYGLDDLHTSHVFEGYYGAPGKWPGLSINDLGPRSKSFYEQGIWAMQDKIEAKYGSMEARPESELIDDDKTCVIHLDGFTIDSPDEVKAILDALPASVENVVFDLSYNTGGNIGAVFRIFGYMTEDQFTYHSQNPADNSAVTIFIESDYVAYDYNWYIISSKVSFSAANLMISMAKENDIATIMGNKSSGGASSIGTIISPDGTVLLVSTNSVLSTRVGNETDGYEYLSIEYGVDPDYIMGDETSDSEIISIITQDQAE